MITTVASKRAPALAIRPSIETSPSGADASTGPTMRSTLRPSSGAAMQLSAPGSRTQLSAVLACAQSAGASASQAHAATAAQPERRSRLRMQRPF